MGRLFLDGFLYYVWNKLFRLDLVRTANLAFQTDLRYGEDLTFCMEYIRHWFAAPGSEGVAFCRAPLYYYETGNEASITYLYKPCYCEDEVRLTGRLLGWFSEDFPLQTPEQAPFFIHLLRTIAGGLSVDLAQPDGYALARRHLTCPTVQNLLAQAAGINAYTPFCCPCAAAGSGSALCWAAGGSAVLAGIIAFTGQAITCTPCAQAKKAL